MAIIHTRIDNRLIHGQVATMWTNELKVTRIMVIDDDASQDDLKKMALKMATPTGVALSVLSIEKAANNINSGKYNGQRVLIILGSIATLVKLLNCNVDIKSCNIGNLPMGKDKVYIAPTVAIDINEAKELIKISNRGVDLTLQLIPSNPVKNLVSSMKKAFKEKGIEL